MGSIVDFASLSTAVANWMARPGNSDFTGNVGDFIGFGEAMMNYGFEDDQYKIPPLRVRQMEVAATTFTVLNSTNTVGLPSDYLELRRNYMTGNPNIKLKYVTPNQMDECLATYPAGPQEFFTIQGDAIYLASNVQTTQTLVGGYYRKIAPLSSSNTTNWLVRDLPNLYLAATCFQGCLFLGDDEGAVKWAKMFSGLAKGLQSQDLKGKYNGSPLQMMTNVGNP